MLAQTGVKRHPKKIPIFLPGRSHPIGFVQAGVFHKSISGSKHILRKPRAIAFDRSTLTDAERAGAVSVRVVDDETRTVYTARIDDIWRYGLPVLRGYGDQIGLEMKRWTVNGQAPAHTFNSNAEIQAAQPSLFGGMAE